MWNAHNHTPNWNIPQIKRFIVIGDRNRSQSFIGKVGERLIPRANCFGAEIVQQIQGMVID